MDNLTEEEKCLIEVFGNRRYSRDSKYGHNEYLVILAQYGVNAVPFFKKFYKMEFANIGKLSNYLRFRYFESFDAKNEFYAVIREAIVSKYPRLELMLQHQKQ